MSILLPVQCSDFWNYIFQQKVFSWILQYIIPFCNRKNNKNKENKVFDSNDLSFFFLGWSDFNYGSTILVLTTKSLLWNRWYKFKFIQVVLYLHRMSNSTKTLVLLPLFAVTWYVPPSEMRAFTITKVEFLEIIFPDCDSLVQVMFGFGSPVTMHGMMACSPCVTLTIIGHWRVGCTAIIIRWLVRKMIIVIHYYEKYRCKRELVHREK